MKRLLMIVVAVSLFRTGPATAENPLCATYAPQMGGHIGLAIDPSGWSPCLNDEVLFAPNTIYIVHTLAPSGNTSQFCVTTNWEGPALTVDYGSNLTLGDLYTGVTVTYVGCKQLPYVVATLAYVPVVPTPQCTYYFRIVADPAVLSGEVEVVDCDSNTGPATGGWLWVNFPGCTGTLCGGPECPVAIEHATWGGIKSLYH
jgi:hypothetical protein